MASWSKKIYLSFWLSLLFFTAVGALWLPSLLDQGKETSIKSLEAAPKLDNLSEETVIQVITKFPTRPFMDSPRPVATASLPERIPSSESPASAASPVSGLPARVVDGVDAPGGQTLGERVTTRAYLRADSSVYAQPQTTAAVLVRVGSEAKVRWLDKAGEGWEEILLKDGRSAYVQSADLSFSSQGDDRSGFNAGPSDGPDIGALPGAVETFLGSLSRGDLLRAETHLSPLASGLEREALGTLGPYVSSQELGRIQRIEVVAGGRDNYRMVRVAYGDALESPVGLLWEWDATQSRWMLVRWE